VLVLAIWSVPPRLFGCRPHSLELSWISSGTRPSVWTVSDGCLKRTCLFDTSAFSALEVLTTTALYKFTYLLTSPHLRYGDVMVEELGNGMAEYDAGNIHDTVLKHTYDFYDQ